MAARSRRRKSSSATKSNLSGKNQFRDETGRLIRVKKSKSQHFLVDKNIVDEMINGLSPLETNHSCDRVLEIGPGHGAITERLLQQDSRILVALESDPAMAKILEQRLQNNHRLRILQGDALQMSWVDLGLGVDRYTSVECQQDNLTQMDVISNVPFAVTGKFLYTALDQHVAIRRLVLLVQQEVAQRLTATPADGRSYSTLSVEFQLRGLTEVLRWSIPREAFVPPPKVNTSLVMADWARGRADSQVQNWNVEHWAHLRKVLKAAFGQRELQLKESLLGVIDAEFLNASGYWWHLLCGPDLTPPQYATLITELSTAKAFLGTASGHSNE